MKLIIGMGNIGAQYNGTRHNVGFAALDSVAASLDIAGAWQTKDKFKSLVAVGSLHGQKVLLAKPTTYYNLAGEAARAIVDFYKLGPADILVIHDDLDLPVGTLRTRVGGSDGGSNGLKSLIAHIGAGFGRIRMGIAGEHRGVQDAADYVLQPFLAHEAAAIEKLEPHIKELAGQFITGNFAHTTNKL